MADLTFNWDEEIRVFGLEQTNNWGTLVWGTDKWGNGNNVIKAFDKVVEETIGIDDQWSNAFDLVFSFEETIPIADELDNVEITDSAGYKRVFQDSTDATESPETSYTNTSNTSSSYTRVTTPSTTWTEQ